MKASLKRASELTQSQSSDDEEGGGSSDENMNDEENDKVLHIGEDLTAFRQVDYLWLFNNELKFSARNPPIELDDAKLSVQDFMLMRLHNRRVLTEFCKGMQRQFAAYENNNPEEEDDRMAAEEEVKEGWADECLDEELKAILAVQTNGKNIEVDIISHLEYFYNTLDCNFTTKNPFDAPKDFPALLFRKPISSDGSSGCVSPSALPLSQTRTLLEMHRLIIFPNSQASKNLSKSLSYSKSSQSPDVSPIGTTMLQVNGQFSQNTVHSGILLPSKYKWYPNESILSPRKNRMAISPNPKNIVSSFQRRNTMTIKQDPYQRMSVCYGQQQPGQQLQLQVQPTQPA